MVKLINVTTRAGLKHKTYGQVYHLNEGLTLIGSNANSNIILNELGQVSRQHAFIVEKNRLYYVGDISTHGTYIHARKSIFSHYPKIPLLNALEASCLRDAIDKDKNYKFKRAESIVEGTFDQANAERNYLLNQFLKEKEAIEKLLGEARLFKLEKRDIIEIHPGFLLKFKR